ncbi:MAG: replicative DNA helicase [Candidatus Zophobacter franzmannii]|nr:replicative DNA helicase [Candidatus Zophobacter franzmannii]
MSDNQERNLPYDINAEAAVISAMMIDQATLSHGVTILKPEYFYRTSHRIIFDTMIELYEENLEADPITILSRLTRKDALEKVGGSSYITEISDVVLSSANFEYHSNIIIDHALLRQLIAASNNIIESARTSDLSTKEIVDQAEQLIFEVAERPGMQAFQSIAEIITPTLSYIEQVKSSHTQTDGIVTGYNDLDRITGGFRPGQFIVLAARPAMGKTSFALNIGLNAAILQDKKVAIFTMEMGADEIVMRMLSSSTEVKMESMLKGYGLDEPKMNRITNFALEFANKAIYIDDAGTNTALDIRAKSRRLKAELGGLDLILIDYLQLMSSARNRDNRQQEISEISRAMKILAKELQLPVVALSQLNRSLESRPDKRPMLSDLRESGAIEQDADMVMFIYRDEYYNKESEFPGIAEIIIGKNRHGPTGNIKLRWEAEFTTFKSLDNQH